MTLYYPVLTCAMQFVMIHVHHNVVSLMTTIHGVVWAYRNTPHSSTGEKPSYLPFGMDCRTPTEAALLPHKPLRTTEISDYREEMVIALSSARALAMKYNQKSQ